MLAGTLYTGSGITSCTIVACGAGLTGLSVVLAKSTAASFEEGDKRAILEVIE